MTYDEGPRRYDRTLRVVMWCDAFFSVELVLVSAVAAPIVATLGVPHRILFGLGVGVLICAIALAAFGAITGVLLMLRMRAGNYFLPHRLNIRPLPSGMRPEVVTDLRSSREYAPSR